MSDARSACARCVASSVALQAVGQHRPTPPVQFRSTSPRDLYGGCMLRVTDGRIVDDSGAPLQLRGTCVGGWMNMEDFIDGYPGSEHGIRAAMTSMIGPAKAEFFFERLLDHFFTEDDVRFMKACGATVVRLPLNYRHFERDAAPFQYEEAGFA